MPKSARCCPTTLTILLAAAALIGSASSTQAQVVLSESFGTTAYAFPAGWLRVNNSQFANTDFDDGGWGDPRVPPGTGGAVDFPAQAGGESAYLAVSFVSSLGTAPAVVSNWLVTPALTLSPNSVFSFFSRSTGGNVFGDRLQVWLSPTGGTNIGPNPIVGTPNITAGDQIPQPNTNSDFLVKLFDINPNELQNTATAFPYPEVWTQFSITLGTVAGVPGAPFTGRIGFRYYAEDGGEGASNRPGPNGPLPFTNLIGVDTITVVNPIPEPTSLALTAALPALAWVIRRRRRHLDAQHGEPGG